jgi:predicted Ser/Thr protein kinase
MSIQIKLSEQLGEDGKEGITLLGTVTKRFSGECYDIPVRLKKGQQVAVKTFKQSKSIARIKKEASLQQLCAAAEVSPVVYGVDTENKHIIMEKMSSLPVEMYSKLPDDLQYQICALMHRMDNAKVMHADMNARNVMLNNLGRPYMIDFGFAKKIDAKITRKFGEHPNVKVTLWGLVRGFTRNKVECDIMDACVKAKEKSIYFEKGEQLLSESGHRRKKRKR